MFWNPRTKRSPSPVDAPTATSGPIPSGRFRASSFQPPATSVLFGGLGQRWLWLLLGVVLAYVAVGLVPLVPVEGDDIAIAAGALNLSLYSDLDHGFDYRYDTQPLAYLLPAAIDRGLGIPPMTGFGLLTLAGFAAFFGFGAWLVARETNLAAPLAGLALLAFQETYVSGCYANSSMMAAGLLFASAFLASRRSPASLVGAGVLFAAAVLARFDAVLMGPAILILLSWPGSSGAAGWPGSSGASPRGSRAGDSLALDPSHSARCLCSGPWARVVVFWVACAGALLVASYAAGVSPGRIWQERSAHAGQFASLTRTLMNYATLASGVGVLLWLIGLKTVLNERNWRLLLLSLAGCVPLVAAYGATVTTPKYLLYGLPFFALLVACGLKALLAGGGEKVTDTVSGAASAGRSSGKPPLSMNKAWGEGLRRREPAQKPSPRPSPRGRAGLRWACVALLVVQYGPGPLTLTSWLAGRNVVVVGTHDGLRRLDAVAYVPLMWLCTKLGYQRGLSAASAAFGETCVAADNALVLSGDWFSSKWASYQLLRGGYRCVESQRHFEHIPIATERDYHVFAKEGKRVTTFQVQWVEGARTDAASWRNRLSLERYDAVLLLGRPSQLEGVFGGRIECQQLAGLAEFERLPMFRVTRVKETR